MVLVAGAVPGDCFFQNLARLVVLAAVQEDLHERVARLLLLVEDGSIECDEMVLGGQLEAAHAIGGFRKAFVLGERVHLEDALRAVRVLLPPPAEGGQRLGAELALGKPRPRGDVPGGFRQSEAPAFPVIFRRFPRRGDFVKHRTIPRPRRAFRAALRPGLAPLGEGLQRRERLQFPRLLAWERGGGLLPDGKALRVLLRSC